MIHFSVELSNKGKNIELDPTRPRFVARLILGGDIKIIVKDCKNLPPSNSISFLKEIARILNRCHVKLPLAKSST